MAGLADFDALRDLRKLLTRADFDAVCGLVRDRREGAAARRKKTTLSAALETVLTAQCAQAAAASHAD